MGLTFSDLKDSGLNSYIARIFGNEEITSSDPFWNQLLSFPYTPDYSINENNFILTQSTLVLECLNEDNLKFKNICHLVSVFLIRSEELKSSSECSLVLSKYLFNCFYFLPFVKRMRNKCEEVIEIYFTFRDSIFLKQIYNCLFVIRNIFKALVEKNKVQYLLDNDNKATIRKLLNTLLSISIEIIVNTVTYFVHLEIIMILNIIMNCDLYIQNSRLLQDLLFEDECTLHSRAFIKKLLENIIEFHSTKSIMKLNQGVVSHQDVGYTGSLLRFVSFGYLSGPTNPANDVAVDCLSSECVFLILKLCLHTKTKDSYKKSFIALFDSTLCKEKQSSEKCDQSSDSTLEMSFGNLLQALCSNFVEEHFVLLFYLLIHININFRQHVLSREHFKDIILPLIKLVYNYQSDDSNSVYMALIILLIMTENSYFNSSIHRETVDYVSWIREKTITNISLGSIIVWILCRVIQFNFGYVGDRYIHINCLAALANMSSKFINLHPVASEQLMVLLSLLVKRKELLSKKLKTVDENEDSENLSNLANNFSIIEEILQMFVEIINTALIFSLNNNPHMIHTFLYHRKIFSTLKDSPVTQNHAGNIDAILTYFSSKIDSELGKSASSQSEVLKVIKKYSPAINKLNNFKRFPELKFKYIEQESADEFFIPYIWKLLCKKSLIYFKNGNAGFPTSSQC